VVCEDQQLTYRELNRRTNQLGHYLRSLGVGPDTRVAICLERGLDMMTAVLGVLKAGGAYVPLDAGYPKDRLRYMAEDTKPSLIISSRALEGETPEDSEKSLFLDDERQRREIERQPEENLSTMVTGESLAYVMYTSGSTGRPKGVMIHHAGMFNHLRGKV